MRYENGHIVTDYAKRAKTDQSLKGINKIARELGKEEADRLIGANSSILDEDYEYVGIGVIQHGENFSYVVIVD